MNSKRMFVCYLLGIQVFFITLSEASTVHWRCGTSHNQIALISSDNAHPPIYPKPQHSSLKLCDGGNCPSAAEAAQAAQAAQAASIAATATAASAATAATAATANAAAKAEAAKAAKAAEPAEAAAKAAKATEAAADAEAAEAAKAAAEAAVVVQQTKLQYLISTGELQSENLWYVFQNPTFGANHFSCNYTQGLSFYAPNPSYLNNCRLVAMPGSAINSMYQGNVNCLGPTCEIQCNE